MTAKKQDNSTVSRPRRKADSSVKGKQNRWEGSDYVEFVPTGTRESNRKMLKQLGNSSFYKSEGEKESSYSLHLNVDGKSDDPVAEMLEQFLLLTEGERKQMPTIEHQGRMLYDDKRGLQVWLDSEAKKVSILAQLDCTSDIERQLLQAQATMNVTIGRYRNEIINSSINNK